MKKSILQVVALCSLAFGQPWLNQSTPPGFDGQPPMEMPFDSSQTILDRIVRSSMPVLVDFWAPWCGPCRMLGPVIEELKKKYAGKVSFEKINIDVHRNISAYFRISAIPAVFIINNKAIVNYLPGLQPKDAYEQALQSVLHPPNPKPSDELNGKQPPKNANKKPSEQQTPAPAVTQ
ncbi:MAG: thioredoxin [Chitinivibrionales bacterium]